MNQPNYSMKVTTGMYVVQLMWTLAFLGVMLIINIAKNVYAGFQGNEVEGFFNSVFIAGNVYMLILGLIAINFLPYFVGNGITRKDYFIGSTIASLLLSISIAVITVVIFFIEKLIFNMLDFTYKIQTINELDLDGNIIGDTIQSIILSPYVDPNENWLLAMLVLTVNIFVIYLLGWFISASFYRFDWLIGLVSIVIAVVFKLLKDTFLRITLDLPVVGWFSTLDFLPMSIALVGIALIIVISIYLTRILTKRVVIKM
mgnify:CR=1 FL=1